jgi:multiple sugar transport system permease protein
MLKLTRPSSQAVFAGVATAIAVFLLFPVLWLVLTALKPDAEIFVKLPALLPSSPTLAHFEQALKAAGLATYLRNSLLTATGSAILTTVLAALAAYGFAKFRFRARQPLMLALIAAQMFPFGVLLMTLYPMLKAVGLLDTLTGLTLSYIVFALPTGTYMLYAYFAHIPDELLEAARIDGAGELTVLARVVLPLSFPGLIAVGVYAFMWAWNDLFYSLTIISSKELRTVGPGLLLEFFGEMQQDWGAAMAASFLASAPVVLVFAFLQRYFIQGLTAGAVKA